MGRTRGAYKEEFQVGSTVQILSVEELGAFARSWKFHHPLSPEQIQFGGKIAKIKTVGFYQGGDELYELRGLPGYWHEQCLRAAAKS
jgi:hypothetical protein